MVLPVVTFRQGFAFGARGTMWSCNAVAGKGVHTGTDLLADAGAMVRAARPGKVKHVNFGSALGNHQIVVLNDDGTLDMYAHMRMRIADGTRVQAGQKVGEIGAEGNTNDTPHLHFERHRDQQGWRCGVHVDPKASLSFDAPPAPTLVAVPAPRVDLEGASVPEVAREEGISPNNAAVRLHRARAELFLRLKQTCGTCTEHGCLDCHCRPGKCS